MERNYHKPSWTVKRLFKQTLFQSKINIRKVLKTWTKSLISVIVKLLELLHGCFPNISKSIYIFEHSLQSLHPTNTPRIFHVETTWNTRGVFKYLNGQKIIYQALRIFFSNKLHGNSWYISWGSVWWIRTWTLTLHTLVLKACLS